MRAAAVHGFGEPLEIEDRPIPSPDAHQVLVRMEASGLCHTDIHAWREDGPVEPTPPFVPGHEGIGIVEAVGSDVTRVAAGDRVAIPWLGTACGTCEHCVGGWETLCEVQQNSGYSVDGAYAEYALADSRYVGIVPDGVDPRDAAPLSCAGSHLQGGQGGGHASVRPRHGVRDRSARPPRCSTRGSLVPRSWRSTSSRTS